MANLKDIRNRIKSVKSIQQVTSAMKMVAAAKMRRAQENMEKSRPYSSRLAELLNMLIPEIDRSLMPELNVREVKKTLFVVVTADRGMAGAFNTNVLREAHKAIDKTGQENSEIICIGKKSVGYFKNRNYPIVVEYIDFWNDLGYSHAMKIGDEIISRYINGDVDQVQVVYNRFVNVARQEIRNETFLPMSYDPEAKDSDYNPERLFEPSKESVVKTIIPRYLNTQMWQFLLESNASEQAARMLAMENATSNANDMIKDLKLQFNKARQTSITTEMLEIVSGAEALS
ncbi:MAG: ATP synthase F1 subunit gamma [Candidatus Marinimicrobia bacterium]|nr:ATP synthase F1 subunit gamma [Candidatus Neomarinimicrobiota bacterium]